jgi:hypothetical protein
MNKHTPGPWAVDKTVDGKHHIVTLPDGRIGAYCGCVGAHDDAESQANAKLIASAPRMLEALKLCIAALERGEHCSKERFDAALNEGHAVCNEIGSPA